VIRAPSIIVLVVLSALGTACGDHPTSPARAALTTDATQYVAAAGHPLGTGRVYSFTLISRFTNTGTDTVHLSRCFPDTPYPIHGISSADGNLEVAYDPGWGCPAGSYFAVAPGTTRVDTLPIQGPWSVDGRTGVPLGVFEGRFVLLFDTFRCLNQSSSCSPTRAAVRSNTFTVTRSDAM